MALRENISDLLNQYFNEYSDLAAYVTRTRVVSRADVDKLASIAYRLSVDELNIDDEYMLLEAMISVDDRLCSADSSRRKYILELHGRSGFLNKAHIDKLDERRRYKRINARVPRPDDLVSLPANVRERLLEHLPPR